MFIKSVILDGFKSYGQRTEINGFDDKFTAITGLNGTGKSNILDAICFVLGISNLTDVRANSLQELIYKCGQSGVNKATVSILFDNRNPEQCPPGFENIDEIIITRQIVIGGKNKYMINGTTVQNKKIQDLFCSVQLNINNPHFLIMQGKITKVLNMKPAEILAMIEEAAGTKMYEVKKQATQKLIDKKDARLSEMELIITEELYPTIKKLREEREKYVKFKEMERDLGYNIGIYKAFEYLRTQKATETAKNALDKANNELADIKAKIAENKDKIKRIVEEIEEFRKKNKSEESPLLKKLQTDLKEEEKIEAKSNSKIQSLKNDISIEETNKKRETEALEEDRSALASKEAQQQAMRAQFEALQANESRLVEAMTAARRQYEALLVGVEINDEGETESLLEQLMNAKRALSETQAARERAQMQLEHGRGRLEAAEGKAGADAADYQRDEGALRSLEKEAAGLRGQLERVGFSKERWDEMGAQKGALEARVRPLRGQVEGFEASKPYASFRYRDPETNFDRRSVHGPACRLFKVKDPKANVALETAAGGRLYNVIVDSNTVSKKLLERGNLRMRTTFIPLSQIRAHKISDSVVRTAQDLVGRENVQLALSHITYDNHLQPAMEYIFGSTFICSDLNVARKIAFHEKIRAKCVTLDGDVVEPAGTLSGGAAKKGASVLQQIADVKAIENELAQSERELDRIDEEMERMRQSREHHNTLKQKFELKSHEIQQIKLRMQQSSHHMQMEEIKGLRSQIEELVEKIKTCDDNLKKFDKKVKELEFKSKNDSQAQREQALKEAEARMNKTKSDYDKSQKEWTKIKTDNDTIAVEIEELQKSIKNTLEQIESIDKTIGTIHEQLGESEGALSELKVKIDGIRGEVQKELDKIAAKNQDVQAKLNLKDELSAEISELELKLIQMGHDMKQLKDDYRNLSAKYSDCEKKFKKNDEFFEAALKLDEKSGKQLEKVIRQSRDTIDRFGRSVNAKAQSMLNQEEAQYNATRKKQRLVENDKKKLLAVMANCDSQKQKTLTLAFTQISKDFGSIFGMLLPGANAKLSTPRGQTILQGIEIKVCLGDVWKENLTELSGGQRSLAALSLILSMLLFKPAPLYILDEVDAALDLSHTQNIGNMLKTHFKKSQFIIVSLKDGMFNNANVLFRTKFVDGVSAVSRNVNKF